MWRHEIGPDASKWEQSTVTVTGCQVASSIVHSILCSIALIKVFSFAFCIGSIAFSIPLEKKITTNWGRAGIIYELGPGESFWALD